MQMPLRVAIFLMQGDIAGVVTTLVNDMSNHGFYEPTARRRMKILSENESILQST